MFDDLQRKIAEEQKAKLDEFLFNWLEKEGYSLPRTLDGITNFLKERNLEISSDMQEMDGSYLHTFKLVKIISTTKILVKAPKIIIDHDPRQST
jgi:hypothetical protein